MLRDGKTCFPIIIILSIPELPLLRLTGKHRNLPRDIDPRKRIVAYAHSPLERSPSGSALEAFISFAKEKGFEEVPK
jgi:hypothetical protein